MEGGGRRRCTLRGYITRRDALGYLAILGLCLAACVLLGALEGPRQRLAPLAEKYPEPVVLVREEADGPELVRLGTPPPEAEPVNPTPLSEGLYRAVRMACDTYQVPECLALGLIEVESGFDAEAAGPDGQDIGLFQIRTGNHAWLSAETGADPMTPEGNIQCGVYMLSYLMGRYEAVEAALTAYRWGHDNGDRAYSGSVLEKAEVWSERHEWPRQNQGV